MKRAMLSACACILLALQPSAVRAQDGLNKRVDELGQQIAAKMTAKQKTTVAVVEFTDLQGNTTDFGRFLAEELITRLMETEKFRVIERQLLNKIIAEQKLSLTGVIDPASAKQLGKILGVEAIVAGTVTNLSQSLKVNARLISTETGEIFSVASAEIFKDESVVGLLTGGGGTASASPTPKPTPQAAAKSTPAQRVRDFIIELKSCKQTGDSVVCFLTVKNDSDGDQDLSIYANEWATMAPTASRLFDEFGNEYLATGAWLGSKGSTNVIHMTYNTLVSQVPTSAAVQFEKVYAQASKATLSLAVRPERGETTTITFRNIQLVK